MDFDISIVDGSPEDWEPLGCQDYLYDVNIEYNHGGNKASTNAKHSFKLKNLPYMVYRDNSSTCRDSSTASSDDSLSGTNNSSKVRENHSISHPPPGSTNIDVSKISCAFLGNSEFVPTNNSRRRVILELISAKLSQPSSIYVPPNSSHTSLNSLTEQRNTPDHDTNSVRSNGSSTRGSSIILPEKRQNGQVANPQTVTTSPSSSSRRFVNYTILIKTAPGLDKFPAVIERRFSDFLHLYQGLKNATSHGKFVDQYINFPKKVFMGNFSLTNIAERTIEFARLLNLCMARQSLLWSEPFVSFLLDKELKEAHKLSLYGNPDDVQALIETAYYIEQKLYLNGVISPCDSRSDSSSDLFSSQNNRYSPSLPNGMNSLVNSSSNDAISAESNQSEGNNWPVSPEPVVTLTNCSTSNASESSESLRSPKNTRSSTLNQRILVTFCMLFVTYYRGENYQELKSTVQTFSQLIASHEYVDTLINTRHYSTLRACLLFLMNMNKGNSIDDDARIMLKRRLEDIDGIQASASLEVQRSLPRASHNRDLDQTNSSFSGRFSNDNSNSGGTHLPRNTKNDLTSLLRDRNFCTF